MNLNDYTLDYLISKEILQTRFDRLTTWQKFTLCLWLLGWSQSEIAEKCYMNRQDISYTINEAKKIMGVYHQWSKQSIKH